LKLSLVVAMARNGVIGRDGGLPWQLPADLKRFRAITMGKPIVMGRRTHESIGRALPGRRNIVLSREPTYQAADCEVFVSLDAALAALSSEAEVMIIGGAVLYAEALPRAARLYLTEVDAELAGDVHFPDFDPAAWHELERDAHGSDASHRYRYSFVVLERINPRAARSAT
jgi:dihydrofolate reductase